MQNLLCEYEKAIKMPQLPVPSTTTSNIGGFAGASALAVQDACDALPGVGALRGYPRGPGCG